MNKNEPTEAEENGVPINKVKQEIMCKFFCCYPDIPQEDFSKFTSWDDQKTILHSTVLHNLNKKYPVKSTYQIVFLKKLINSLEAEQHEVRDEIYEELCKFQSQPEENSKHSYKHYILPKRNVIFSLQESKSFVSNGTTGLCTWQASLALANWILNNPECVSGKKVLELGSGTGLLGFIASRCCQTSQIILSDGSIEVLKLLNENLKRNFLNAVQLTDEGCFQLFEYNNKKIGILLLSWEEVQTSRVEEIICPDVILAADVVYDRSIFVPLADTLDYIFQKAGNKCSLILASTIRNERTLQDFYLVLEQRNFVLDRRKSINCEEKELCCHNSSVEIAHVYKNKL